MKTLLFFALAAYTTAQVKNDKIFKEVGHELVTLPNHGVFDNLNYRVEGTKVTLFGQVVDPALKSSVEKAVKTIEGVQAVDNQLEVLPRSDVDDRIRGSVYRAIYAKKGMEHYQFAAVAGIHIIVKNGTVTLVGAVRNETDKNLAGAAANGVLDVAKVNNNLIVAN